MYRPSSFSRSSDASCVPAAFGFGDSNVGSGPTRDRFLARRLTSSTRTGSDDVRDATLSFRRVPPFLLMLLSLRGDLTPFTGSRRSMSFGTSVPRDGIVWLRRLLPTLSIFL